jgi:serine/threonine protein kinase
MKSSLFCPTCGAENALHSTTCFACQKPLDATDSLSEAPPLLNERYSLIAPLGKGGYGAVYKALDSQAPTRAVAIKQIHLTGLSAEESIEATETFNREARILSNLSHPQLPHIYDQFSDRDDWYLVMDYIEGQTLDDAVEENRAARKPFSISEILTIGCQLCEVLNYLHTRQPPVIFRDLKPGNVIRSRSGQLSLIDFGIARTFHEGQKHDTLPLGSPGYAAPEQYGRAQTTPQSDIYSLGALLHFLLSEHDPSEQPMTFEPLSLPDFPGRDELTDFVQRMLSPEAEKRPQSATEVAAVLQSIRQRQQVLGPLIPPPPPFSPSSNSYYTPSGLQQQIQQSSPAQRKGTSRRAVLSGGLAGLGVLILSGVGWSIYTHQASPYVSSSAQATVVSNPVSTTDQSTTTLTQGTPYWSHTLKYAAFSSTFGYGFIAILDCHTNQVVKSIFMQGSDLTSSSDYVNAVYWSPDDSNLLIEQDANPQYQIWDLTGPLVAPTVILETKPVDSAAWSSNSGYLATGASGLLQVWDGGSGSLFQSLDMPKSDEPMAIAWSPDDTRVAALLRSDSWSVTAWDISLTAWDIKGDQNRQRFSRSLATGLNANIDDKGNRIAWSPDGKYLAVGVGNSLWIVNQSGDAVLLKQESDAPWTFAWSPDSKLLALLANGGKTVEVWIAATAGSHKVGTFTDATDDVELGALAWSTDGKSVLAVDSSVEGNGIALKSWQVVN